MCRLPRHAEDLGDRIPRRASSSRLDHRRQQLIFSSTPPSRRTGERPMPHRSDRGHRRKVASGRLRHLLKHGPGRFPALFLRHAKAVCQGFLTDPSSPCWDWPGSTFRGGRGHRKARSHENLFAMLPRVAACGGSGACRARDPGCVGAHSVSPWRATRPVAALPVALREPFALFGCANPTPAGGREAERRPPRRDRTTKHALGSIEDLPSVGQRRSQPRTGITRAPGPGSAPRSLSARERRRDCLCGLCAPGLPSRTA